MREDPPTLEESLKKVHHLSMEASWLRKKLVKAMSDAKRLGASHDELSQASGDLSAEAVRSLLRAYPDTPRSDR